MHVNRFRVQLGFDELIPEQSVPSRGGQMLSLGHGAGLGGREELCLDQHNVPQAPKIPILREK